MLVELHDFEDKNLNTFLTQVRLTFLTKLLTKSLHFKVTVAPHLYDECRIHLSIFLSGQTNHKLRDFE